MHDSSVVLPQPDAPIATTKSPSRIAEVDVGQRLDGAGVRGVADAEMADVELGHEASMRTAGE